MARKTVRSGLHNLILGTELNQANIASLSRDREECLYNIEELREIWEFIAQVFERFCFVFILYSILCVTIWAFMVPSYQWWTENKAYDRYVYTYNDYN